MTLQTKTIILNAIVPEELSGSRLDQTLAKLFPDYSRSRLQAWIKASEVRVDEKFLRAKDKVYAPQTITISAELRDSGLCWEPQAVDVNIVYEDADIIVINKPAGVVVHPGSGNPRHTLINALLHHAPELELLPRAGIVHRIDKDTSGLLVIARSLEAHTALTTQIQAHQVKREYRAIAQGVMTAGGTITAPIGRHATRRTQMAVTDSGKPAITHYRVIEKFRAHTYIKVMLETGRTHQIRVHMAHIKHALLGDPTYAGRCKLPAGCSANLLTLLQTFKRQALHAHTLSLQHPKTGLDMQWSAPIPQDFEKLLLGLREGK